jgi:ribulose-phosphate 3-epimerase
MKNYVSASILSADMLRLEQEVRRIEKSGIEMLHFDVMDGVFVNNISYGLPILSAIRKITDLTLDVHLMITEPIRYIPRFAEAGADIISFHTEAAEDVSATLDVLRKTGKKSALAIKPGTPAEVLFPYLDQLDMALVMTVEPGFGGQRFIHETMEKVRILREKAPLLDIQVDGGINAETAAIAREAGANNLVSGSYLFSAEDMSLAAQLVRTGSSC